MQIHELTKTHMAEASIADTIRSAAAAVKTNAQAIPDRIAAANATMATSQQAKTQAQAAKYAQILQRQGYGTAATSPTPVTMTAIQTPAATMRIGNKILDPNNPADAKIIAQVQATQATQQPAQPTATTTPAGAVPVPQSVGAVNTNRLQAGAVATGGAPAVMLAGDFNKSLTQMSMNTNHIQSLKDGFAANPSLAVAFLKATGLSK